MKLGRFLLFKYNPVILNQTNKNYDFKPTNKTTFQQNRASFTFFWRNTRVFPSARRLIHAVKFNKQQTVDADRWKHKNRVMRETAPWVFPLWPQRRRRNNTGTRRSEGREGSRANTTQQLCKSNRRTHKNTHSATGYRRQSQVKTNQWLVLLTHH